MSWNTYFIQNCTTCGRRLQVRIVDLGKKLVCQHCGADFLAKDNHNESAALFDPVSHWIEIANEVLSADDESVRRPK